MALGAIISAVVLGGALAAPVVAKIVDDPSAPADNPSAPADDPSATSAPASPTPPPDADAAANLSEVKTWEILDNSHDEGDVDYPQSPPAGGPHDPIWLDCGVYDEPVRDENAVHDLEHGAVWITYDPSLSPGDVEVLADQLPDDAIMSPYDGLSSPVVVTAWGAQLALEGATDPRLQLFVAEYGDGHTSPETGATCEGGTPDPSGKLLEAEPAPETGSGDYV